MKIGPSNSKVDQVVPARVEEERMQLDWGQMQEIFWN
jgi:hypothetical protein